jgi:hypothetical protein
MFTNSDELFLQQCGISAEYLDWQLSHFRGGFAPLELVAPAVVGKGIFKPDDEPFYINLFENSEKIEIVKFVPASGAASRMFKDLFAFLEAQPGNQLSDSLQKFFDRIKEFGFFHSLDSKMLSKGSSVAEALEKKEYKLIVETLLVDLAYGTLPKALLEFHRYHQDQVRTPIEEHFVEGAFYAKSGDWVKIHFTVSPEHKAGFEDLVARKKEHYQQSLGIKLQVSYSEQKKSTDTIAVDLENKPFRNSDGSLLLRPAGHGALLENLNDLEADLVFIKNIDNVVPERLLSDTIRYKKILAGVLIEVKTKIFDYLEKLEHADEALLLDIENYYAETLCEVFPTNYSSKSFENKVAYLHTKLSRPIKVCGMVKNEGEPGGGPFWVRDKTGGVSLQIVESAQIDVKNAQQSTLLQSSTHFNPVDLVCWLTDRKGEKFDLTKFRDDEAGFISQKSKDGKELKAIELPGLWNGAMADWNTVFVEVPLSTFNPVKTVFDLLRKEHLLG